MLLKDGDGFLQHAWLVADFSVTAEQISGFSVQTVQQNEKLFFVRSILVSSVDVVSVQEFLQLGPSSSCELLWLQ